MHRVRNAQLSALAGHARAALVEKLLRVVAEQSPSLDVDRTRTLLAKAVERAMMTHQLSIEAAVADYAGLALELGLEFDRDPAVAAILLRDGATPEQRLRAVFDELQDDDWARLRARVSAPTG